MQLFVQGQTLHTLNVSSETTVDDLKGILSQQEGISVEDQVLAYGGVPLEGETLVCQSVPELATVNLTARVIGGEWSGTCPLFCDHIIWGSHVLFVGVFANGINLNRSTGFLQVDLGIDMSFE